jgi:hypothetical protein
LRQDEADLIDDGAAVVGFDELRGFQKVHYRCPAAAREGPGMIRAVRHEIKTAAIVDNLWRMTGADRYLLYGKAFPQFVLTLP